MGDVAWLRCRSPGIGRKSQSFEGFGFKEPMQYFLGHWSGRKILKRKWLPEGLVGISLDTFPISNDTKELQRCLGTGENI